MRIRIYKAADGKFDVLVQPARFTGLPTVLHRGLEKGEQIAEAIRPAGEIEDAERLARKEARRGTTV
jgi:hypothetical protein